MTVISNFSFAFLFCIQWVGVLTVRIGAGVLGNYEWEAVIGRFESGPPEVYKNNPALFSYLLNSQDPLNDEKFMLAAFEGRADTVDTLLQLPHINPAMLDSFAVSLALNQHHWDVAVRLLRDPRVLHHLPPALQSQFQTHAKECLGALAHLVCRDHGLSTDNFYCEFFHHVITDHHDASIKPRLWSKIRRNKKKEMQEQQPTVNIASKLHDLWKQGYFAECMVRVKQIWRNMEWIINKWKAESKYYQERMRAEIEGWSDSDD